MTMDTSTRTDQEIIQPVMDTLYDVLIVGGGVAGLMAAIIGHQRGLKCLVFESSVLVGNLFYIPYLEDFPLDPECVGEALANTLTGNVETLKIPVIYGAVTQVEKSGQKFFKVHTASAIYTGRTVVLATGKTLTKHAMDTDEENSSFSYNAPLEVVYHIGSSVVLLGQNDFAAKTALYLRQFVDHLTIIAETPSMHASDRVIKDLFTDEKITMLFNRRLKSVQKVEEQVLIQVKGPHDENENLVASTLFAGVDQRGNLPEFIGFDIETDGHDFCVVSATGETSESGVFAIGCVRQGHDQRVAQSMNDAYMAIMDIKQVLYSHP